MTVDEILATGQYTDRRGRVWYRVTETMGKDSHYEFQYTHWETLDRYPGCRFQCTEREVSVLIERDMHRDECRGLAVCEDHPVPSINCYYGVFEMWPSGRLWSRTQGRDYNTLSAAMSAARALAVGE